jgi:hypothetical protein
MEQTSMPSMLFKPDRNFRFDGWSLKRNSNQSFYALGRGLDTYCQAQLHALSVGINHGKLWQQSVDEYRRRMSGFIIYLNRDCGISDVSKCVNFAEDVLRAYMQDNGIEGDVI